MNNYRRELDGLRGLAVSSVLLHHAGFEPFSGGFVGVDIFFVVSGYLITAIILNELKLGTFSITNFYERRARRILPALFLVMLIITPFAFYNLLPDDIKDFCQSLAATSVFSSNVLFLHESGYFEQPAQLKPLLHTWSLAVEEQYYIIFPIIFCFLLRLDRPWVLVLALGLIFAISLTLAQWAAYAKPDFAFYSLLTRAWELLLGVFTAIYLSRAKHIDFFGKKLSELGASVGVTLILYSVFFYNEATPFPGFLALTPTLGAVLIILFATQNTIVGRFIGNKAFVGIGLISYSAYLWHQPLFAFAKYRGWGYSSTFFLGLIVCTLALAFVSYRLVETPFRDKSVVSRKAIFYFACFGSIFFAALGIYGHKKEGAIGPWAAEQRDFIAYFNNQLPDWDYFTRTGILNSGRDDCNFFDIDAYRLGNKTNLPRAHISDSCFTKSKLGSTTVFIWGDSHAQVLNYGLSKTLPDGYEVLQVASSGCIASSKAKKNTHDYCEYSNWFAWNAISEIKPEIVIIGQARRHKIDQMESLSAALKNIGVGEVLFVGPAPHWHPSLPGVVARFLPNVRDRSFVGLDHRVVKLDQELKRVARTKNVNYTSLIDYFCDVSGCLLYYDPDNIAATVTSWDDSHLLPIASYHLAKDVLSPKILQLQSNSISQPKDERIGIN
jgi:peptidoglycan/LPS O-acetylase OafA/YrhL